MTPLSSSIGCLRKRIQPVRGAGAHPRFTAVAAVVGWHAMLFTMLNGLAVPNNAPLARGSTGRPPLEIALSGIHNQSPQDVPPAPLHQVPPLEELRPTAEEPVLEIADSVAQQEPNNEDGANTIGLSSTLPRFGLGARVLASGDDVDDDLAASVAQAVASRVETCFHLPAAAAGAAFSFSLTIAYNQDGTLAGPPVLSRLVGVTKAEVDNPEPVEQAAIDAVRRCAPIDLPAALYRYWGLVDIEMFSAAAAPEPFQYGGVQTVQQQGSTS